LKYYFGGILLFPPSLQQYIYIYYIYNKYIYIYQLLINIQVLKFNNYSIIRKMKEIEQSLSKMTIYDNIFFKGAIFTRYLFIKQNCYWTLLLNILNKAKNESLYWAYELYYSGFEKEIIMFIMNIFNIFYVNTTSISFKNIIIEKINLWLKTGDETILGTLIYNICNKNADISEFFIKSYAISNAFNDFNILYEETENGYVLLNNKNNNKNIFVNITEVDIIKYKDINCHDKGYKPNYVLELVTIYRSQCITINIINSINNFNYYTNNIIELFKINYNKESCIKIIKNMQELLVELYYTPIWNNRFEKYGAKITSNYKYENPNIGGVSMPEIKMIFPSDELYEEFCNLYWYEPDENINGFMATRF